MNLVKPLYITTTSIQFTSSSTSSPPVDNAMDTNINQQNVSIRISEHDIFQSLNSLDPCKAVGIDDIRPKVVKGCAVSLYKPFHYLYNLIIRQHNSSTEWCIHCIVPIFKSGDKKSVTNYLPISLLRNSSKVLEQLIYDKIIGHVHKQLSCLQFGFLRNRSVSLAWPDHFFLVSFPSPTKTKKSGLATQDYRSVIQQLLIVFNNIINTPQQTNVIYLDFQKAYLINNFS